MLKKFMTMTMALTMMSLIGCAPATQDAEEKESNSMEPTLRMIESNGLNMRIAEMGEGPLVIFVHGWPESWYSWRHQLPAIAAAGYHAVAPDMRGYGKTDAPENVEDYDIEKLTADIVGVIDALGEETAIVVGHDWGSIVAWNCVLLHPDRFSSLITINIPFLSFVPFCQDCYFCDNGQPYLCEAANKVNMGCQLDGTTRTTKGGEDVQVMNGLGCMAESVVCPSISVVPIGDDIPMEIGALVGCGVTTGVGAALNAAKVQPGTSVAVIGCGGVGLSTIQGAKVAGAKTIIAIDLSPEKLELAKSFGATHGLIADDDLFGNVKGLTEGRGVDYGFEVIGFSKTMELAYNMTRNGGVTTLVGIGKHKDRMSFSALAFPVKAKKLCGCMYGDSNPPEDFPRMLDLYKKGELELDKMITKTYNIDEAPEAFRALEAGENARGVILFN